MRKTGAFVSAAVAAAIAFGMFTGSALAQGPETTNCAGTAGYDSTGTWSFKAGNATVETGVVNPSPNACVNVPEGVPGDTSDVVGEALSVAGNITLSGTGSLSCGNGTLSGTVGETGGPSNWWTGSWSATFQNGVGTVTGSVTPLVSGGTTASLSGTIIVGDGSTASGVGVCNNDGNPSPAFASLSVS